LAILGVMNFDGAGNAAMSITNIGVFQDGSSPPVMGGTITGTYSFNPDGRDRIPLIDSICNPDLTIAIVFTDGGSGLP
jgi:hypothetical protein